VPFWSAGVQAVGRRNLTPHASECFIEAQRPSGEDNAANDSGHVQPTNILAANEHGNYEIDD
jgi:hypothetical protein